MTSALSLDASRAYPHVEGRSTRFKAEPTKLTRLAARVMCASGSFSTEHRAARSSSGRFLGALALVLAAGTLAIAGDARPVDQQARAIATQLAHSDHVLSLGVGEFLDPDASVAEAPVTLDAQDRFEIARLFRLTAVASQALAPAAGPSIRGSDAAR